MEIEKIGTMNVYCFTVETSIAQLGQYVRTKAKELYYSAIEQQLEITGPIYWIYNGMDGNPETLFTLEICLPVAMYKPVNSIFQCKELQPFECISQTLNGNWNNLPETYSQLFAELYKQGLQHNGVCREIYLNMDFNNFENNITKVQVGYK